MFHIDISYYFNNPDHFPWEYMGFDIPIYGPAYLYLCKMLARYEPNQVSFLNGKPSVKELTRYGEANGGLSQQISEYVVKVKDRESFGSTKKSSTQVVEFLREFAPFREAFKNKLESDYTLGRIHLESPVVYYLNQ